MSNEPPEGELIHPDDWDPEEIITAEELADLLTRIEARSKRMGFTSEQAHDQLLIRIKAWYDKNDG